MSPRLNDETTKLFPFNSEAVRAWQSARISVVSHRLHNYVFEHQNIASNIKFFICLDKSEDHSDSSPSSNNHESRAANNDIEAECANNCTTFNSITDLAATTAISSIDFNVKSASYVLTPAATIKSSYFCSPAPTNQSNSLHLGIESTNKLEHYDATCSSIELGNLHKLAITPGAIPINSSLLINHLLLL